MKLKDNSRYMQFNCVGDLKDYMATSLLFYSDEEVASLQVGNIYLSLMVRGEVTIDYKGDRFKNYGQYSQELKDTLRGDKYWYEIDDLEIIDNNWFNLEVYKINEDNIMEFLFDDCDNADFILNKDSEISLTSQLYNNMLEMLKTYVEYDDIVKEELRNVDWRAI